MSKIYTFSSLQDAVARKSEFKNKDILIYSTLDPNNNAYVYWNVEVYSSSENALEKGPTLKNYERAHNNTINTLDYYLNEMKSNRIEWVDAKNSAHKLVDYSTTLSYAYSYINNNPLNISEFVDYLGKSNYSNNIEESGNISYWGY
jgi:hypothetical protein